MPEIPLTPATTSRVPLPNAISLSPAALQSVGPVAWDSSLVFAAIDEEDREAPRLSRHSHVIEQCRTWSSERKPAMRRIAGLLVAMAMVGLAVPGAGANAPPTCFGKPATIVGTSGDDYLGGTDGNDVIVGLGGNDGIDGGGGNDLICGGPGNDSADYVDNGGLTGGSGADKIRGGKGNDSLSGDCNGALTHEQTPGTDGRDKLYGGPGSDELADGCTYHEFLWPDKGTNDYLNGGSGDDSLLTTGGDDKAYGGSGRDHLNFADLPTEKGDLTDYGSDLYHGGSGSDWIYGEDKIEGNDRFYGDGGQFDQCHLDNNDYQAPSCDD